MRKALKFCHTLGGVGLLGTFLTLTIVLAILPDPSQDIHGYAVLTELVDRLARWVLLPSLTLTLVSGLLSIGAVTAFHSAGWAWLKLATGVVMFEGTLLAVQGPIQREANLTRQFLSGDLEASALAISFDTISYSIIVLGSVALANVVLGIWRPRLGRRKAVSAQVAEE
ncbi:MAG: hypothetical protein P8O91_08870 [Luminiphilus sp.]|nr:hypothetical protein [Luminiphilus sp.]